MNQALATRNYDGTFFPLERGPRRDHAHRAPGARGPGDRAAAVAGRLGPRVRAQQRRIDLLSARSTHGAGRAAPDRGPFLGSLPQFGAGRERFLSHRSDSPRPAFSAGRRESLPSIPRISSGSAIVCGSMRRPRCRSRRSCAIRSGEVIEQIFFARLDMPESIPDSELAPAVRTDGMRWVRQGAPAAMRPRRRLPPTAPASCRRDFT